MQMCAFLMIDKTNTRKNNIIMSCYAILKYKIKNKQILWFICEFCKRWSHILAFISGYIEITFHKVY